MRSVHSFNIFADYFQFVVQDESSDDDFAEIWTEEAQALQTAFGRSAVCPGTLRNVDVPVEVIVTDVDPAIDLSTVDHAVEGSLQFPTGRIVVMGCTGYSPDAPRFEIQAGTYRVVAVMAGVQSIKTEWDPAEDKYVVYLWPGAARPPRLLKHWNSGP
ncbi:hypothetical protein [Hydrogenophaga sp. RWCD_12]|uniref:hypothetical protein n=1 Tax=Hydrogenophaga sp. RWCD_12 TaxID=3391190 RepID=UPI0039850A60